MAIVKKISELTAKGSNIGANDLVIVGVDNGTDYDLKSCTGSQLLGAAVAQTITNGVTTTAPSQDAVFDALALKVDVVAGSRLITSAEATVLGNTSGTNTGDETVTTIKSKLGITTLSGSNTGDQDLSSLAPKASPTFTGTVVLPSDTSIGTVSSTELGYLDGVASSVQNQLNAKVNLNTLITAGSGSKVTYDAKGLILSSANATTTDIDVTIQTVTSSATVTPVVANDIVRITALATGVTIANMTSPTDGKVLFVEIKDNGTSRTVAFGTDYVFHVTAITATTISKWLTFGMIYNGNTSKWHILSATSQV
jgi:hypothetical protein